MKYIILIIILMLSCLPSEMMNIKPRNNNNPGGTGADVDLSNYYTKAEIDKLFLELNTTTNNKLMNYYDKDEIDKIHPYNKVETQRSYSYNFDNELKSYGIIYYKKNGFPYKYENYIKNPNTQKVQLQSYTEYIYYDSNLVKEYHHYQDIDFDEIFKHWYSKNTYTFR